MFIDDTKFRQLYNKHFKTIFGFVLRRVHHHHDAEDLTQQTFINIRKRQIEDPLAYLKKVARNVIIQYLREKKKGRIISIEGHFDNSDAIIDLIRNPIDPSTLPTQKKRQELQAYLRELVQKLPEKEKTIIELRYLTEYPLKHKEIQKVLQVSYPKYKKLSYPTYQQLHKSAIAKLLKEIKRYLDR